MPIEAIPVVAAAISRITADLQDQLVPINRRYPLDELMDACAEYLAAKGRRLSFEWALIAGVNIPNHQHAEIALTAILLTAEESSPWMETASPRPPAADHC